MIWLPIFVVGGITLLGISVSCVERENDVLAIVTIMALALTVRAVTIALISWNAPGAVFPDELGYHEGGLLVARRLDDGQFINLMGMVGSIHVGYHYLLGLLYYCFEASREVAISFNSLLGAASIILVYRIGVNIGDEENITAKLAATLVAVSPGMIYWSSFVLKEAAVVFLLLLAVWAYLKLLKGEYKYTIVLLVVMTVLVIFRFYVLFILLPTMIGVAIFSSERRGKQLSYAVGLLLSVWLTAELSLDINLLSLMSVGLIGHPVVLGESAFRGFIETGAGNVVRLVSLPLATIRFLVTPLPWNIEGVYAWLLPEVLFWYVAMPAFVLGLWSLIGKREKNGIRLIIGIVIVGIMVYSVAMATFGAGSVRHRYMLMPFFLIVVSYGLIEGYKGIHAEH